MRYYYLVTTNDYSICFKSKKEMVEHAKKYYPAWYYVCNKRDLPSYVKEIIGNDICKDYHIKANEFVIKDSLKDRRK